MNQKQVFRRMSLDVDVRSLQPGDYRKLYNGIPVSPQSSSYANAIKDVISNVLGNALVSYSLPAGTNKVVGYLEDRAGNRGFYFVANSTPANNAIYQISGSTITSVMQSALLDFVSTDFITADIIGDILVFCNQRTEIYEIDVAKAIAGGTYTPAIEEITLIKRPPQLHLTTAFIYDNDRETNFVNRDFFQFYYRYVYVNNEYSALSAASADRTGYGSWDVPTYGEVYMAADSNQTLSGLATAVDGVTKVAGEKILLFSQTDEKENGIWTMSVGAWARPTDADTGAEIKEISVVVQNGVEYRGKTFRNTNTAAFTVGVDDIFFGPTVGPNAIDVTIGADENTPATVIAVESIVRINGSNEYIVYRIEKTPLASTTHRFYNDSFLYTIPDTQSTRWNDSVPITTQALRVFENRIFCLNNTEGYNFSTTEVITVTINEQSHVVGKYPRAHPKMGGRYSVGIVYFDGYGRISGVQSVLTFEVPTYRGSTGLITGYPSVTIDLTGITNIPTWATHYSVVATNELDRSFFLQHEVTDFYYYTRDFEGTDTYSKSYTTSVTGLAIDIQGLVKENLGYTWTAGDRIKLFSAGDRRDIVVDLKILGQDGNFLFVEPSPLFGLNTGGSTGSHYEIYTPTQQGSELFYEIGNRYEITDPGVSATLSTTSLFFLGDVVSMTRRTFTQTGGYSDTDPTTNAYITFSTSQFFEAMNQSNDNFSTWVKPGGKAIAKTTVDDEQQEKVSSLRFGQIYNSNLNQLNTFFALDEYQLPYENGAGYALSDDGSVLTAINDIETASIYVGEGFVSTGSANGFLSKTDSVIGDDRTNLGGHGTIHPATVVARNGRTYYLDARKGVVVRKSQDGLTVISDYGVKGDISTLCTTHLALGANSRIIAGWDPQYACYVISFIDISSTPTGYTYYFHEESNGWVCLTDYRPEFWGILGQKQIAFLSGALWMQSTETNYNLFFGVQYNRRLEFEISPGQSLEHVWDAVEIDCETIYSTAGTNEDVLLLYHVNGGTLQTRINYADFQRKASAWRSSFFRSVNDVTMANSTESKYKSPIVVRGQSAFLVLTYNGTDRNPLKSITIFYTPSMLSFN